MNAMGVSWCCTSTILSAVVGRGLYRQLHLCHSISCSTVLKSLKATLNDVPECHSLALFSRQDIAQGLDIDNRAHRHPRSPAHRHFSVSDPLRNRLTSAVLSAAEEDRSPPQCCSFSLWCAHCNA